MAAEEPDTMLVAKFSVIREDGGAVVNNNAKQLYAPLRGELTTAFTVVPGATHLLEAQARVQLQTTSFMVYESSSIYQMAHDALTIENTHRMRRSASVSMSPCCE